MAGTKNVQTLLREPLAGTPMFFVARARSHISLHRSYKLTPTTYPILGAVSEADIDHLEPFLAQLGIMRLAPSLGHPVYVTVPNVLNARCKVCRVCGFFLRSSDLLCPPVLEGVPGGVLEPMVNLLNRPFPSARF